jgi:ribose-phosphate pyrophosphokinase
VAVAKKLVLAGPASEELAKSLATRMEIELLKSEFKVFADGESKFTCDGKVSGKTVYLVQSTYPPVDQHLMQLFIAAHQLSQEGARVTAVVPYLAYARQDKEFLPGESITLGVVSHLMRSAGVRRLVTVDIHSPEGLALFSFPIHSVSAIPNLADYARKTMNLKSPVVVAPDFGASTRTEAFASLYGVKLQQLSKSRDRVTGVVKVKEKALDVKGKEVMIVDDVIQRGDTVAAATELVLGQGASKVFAICVHGLFVGDAVRKLEKAGVEKIISTNTVPSAYSTVDVSEPISSHLRTLDE